MMQWDLTQAFALFLHTLGYWWVIIPSVLLGILVGAIPGLNAANTIILLLPLTLAIMFTALVVGFCLALIATTFRVRRVPVISQLADLYVSYARSVPVVLQLFVAFYGLPLLASLFGVPDFLSSTVAAIISLLASSVQKLSSASSTGAAGAALPVISKGYAWSGVR